MPKLTTRFSIALLTFLLGVAAATVLLFKGSLSEKLPQEGHIANMAQEKHELRSMIPNDRWEPIYFKFINERTGEANLPRLRTILLPSDDFEIRVWVGFGQNGEDGLILQRSSDQWSAMHLHGVFERYPPDKYQETLTAPKSGWENAWQRLVEAGILTLPDASAVQCSTHVLDGMSYVVEINMNKTYRTYMYDNPNYAKCNEAKQMIEIGEIIAEEFNLEEFRIRE
ncbi:MAG: hypothetical protein MSG64_20375 [Pyrinomonadaceae bacterium MAG19_C2-C3]|nr:hypothetical protein [Pyrinomonadaceae bacterium MAG19_C2-C3]